MWKDYLTFHAIDRASPLLPKAFAEERFRFYGTALSGAGEAARPVEARGRRDERRSRRRGGEALRREVLPARGQGAGAGDGQEHRRRVRPPHRRPDVDVAGDAREGQGEARDALRRRRLSGHWRDYAGWRSREDDALGNAQRSELFDYHASLAKLGKPVDKREWWMTPQTVNAVNLPLQNALNFPAAILQAAVLRRRRRPGAQLRRHRRGHRPRDQPQLRRPGQPVRRARPAGQLVDAGGLRALPRRPARRSPRSTTPTSRFPGCT